jgi:Mg/Co/Ni transporter MgtE
VFEELNTEHQLEFIRTRSDAEAASLLGTMAPDDAADLIVELDQERRRPILELLPEPQQLKVRSLLSYNPETAGGLMSPDFLCLGTMSTVSDALAAIRASNAPPEVLSIVFVQDETGRICGSVSAVRLIKSDVGASLGSVMEDRAGHVHADWDLGATARKMSDFNLTVAPVMDSEHHRLLGVVTVDDVFELLLPTGWRRDFGQTSPED